tara:strand:- start:272 stop:1087 length:816 start_codon:yes stop_codon:yes gene_type:complete
MEIGIIGYGVVGKAIDKTISQHYEIKKYDKYADLNQFDSLLDCDFVFVSVPTPFDISLDKVDTSAVLENLERLSYSQYKGIILLKSTLPVGSSDIFSNKYNLDIVYNPEFLRESTTPNEDFAKQDCVVIGSPNAKHFEQVLSMYKPTLSEETDYFHLSYLEAEMIKYSQNTVLASRVAISNIIYDACQSKDLDYNKIKEIAFDRFDIIGPHMSQVPGHDGQRGFGGKCLPKDIRGFSKVFPSDLVEQIIKYNDNLRTDLDLSLNNYISDKK